MADNCGTCSRHTFKGLDNWCQLHNRIIPREDWENQRCEDHDDWETKVAYSCDT